MFCAFKLMQLQSKNTIYLNNMKQVGEEQAKENEGCDYLCKGKIKIKMEIVKVLCSYNVDQQKEHESFVE